MFQSVLLALVPIEPPPFPPGREGWGGMGMGLYLEFFKFQAECPLPLIPPLLAEQAGEGSLSRPDICLQYNSPRG